MVSSGSRQHERAAGSADVVRHRLLGVLAGRFDRALTVVEAPAGYGKSTLLRQAIGEAELAGLGRDVLLRPSHPHTNVVSLLGEAVQALVPGGVGAADPSTALRDAVWSASPEQVCLVIDDTHLLAPAWTAILDELLAVLPANGHLVLSGRSVPPVSMVDAAATERIGADDLAFDPDERAAFHRLRGRTEEAGTIGWPAVLELGAAPDDIGRFLDEEVIAALSVSRRDALAVLALHRCFDAELVRAATDYPGTLDELTGGLPLTTVIGGEVQMHDLVREALVARLDETASVAAHRRMSLALADRRAWSDAIELANTIGDRQLLTTIARTVAAELHIGTPDGGWLSTIDELIAALPGSVAADALGALASVTRDQPTGLPLMTAAAERARAEGDLDLEALCVSRLAEAAFGVGRVPMLRVLADRLDALADAGCAAARRTQFRPRLWLRTLDGSGTVAYLDDEPAGLEPAVARLVAFDRIRGLAHQGHVRAALDAAGHLPPIDDPLQRIQMDGFLAIQRWLLGELGIEGVDDVRRLLDRGELRDAAHLFVRAAATTSIMAASIGDHDRATECLDRARQRLHLVAEGAFARHVVAQAEAALAILDGDEDRAAARLREALPAGGLGSIPPFIWSLTAATQYVLLPEVRPFLDGASIGPDLELRHRAAQALVAWRDASDPGPAAALPWSEFERLRSWLTEPHLGELALAACAGGNAAAASTFERFRHDPRGLLARLAERTESPFPEPLVRVARTLPRRPRHTLEIGVLGPVRLARGGVTVVDETWTRRQRVRDLLMLLVANRSIGRAHLLSLIWPDKPPRTAAANLRFTLNQLQAVLEPERAAADPPWYLVAEQDRLVLRDSELVMIDATAFTEAIATGDDFDRAGDPELALAAYRRAGALYRGDFLSDASEPDWGYYEAIRLRGLFVRAAARASSLALVGGDHDDAEQLARRAAAAEPLHEPAVRAFAAALMAQRRLGAARETLRKLASELASAGVTPEPATSLLLRRLGGD